MWWLGRALNPAASLFRAIFSEPKPFFNQQLNPSGGPSFSPTL